MYLGVYPLTILSRCATIGYVGLQSLKLVTSLPSITHNKNKTFLLLTSIHHPPPPSLDVPPCTVTFSTQLRRFLFNILFTPITPPILVHFPSLFPPLFSKQKSAKRIFIKLPLEKIRFLSTLIIIHDPLIHHASLHEQLFQNLSMFPL